MNPPPQKMTGITSNLRKNAHMLLALFKGNHRIQRVVLKAADDSLVQSVCECALNVVKNDNVKVTPTQKRRLKRFMKELRKLTYSKTSKTQKRKIIQTGGFLPAVIGPLVGLLTGVIGGLL